MKISEGDFIFELKFLAIHPQTHNIQTDVFLQVSLSCFNHFTEKRLEFLQPFNVIFQ